MIKAKTTEKKPAAKKTAEKKPAAAPKKAAPKKTSADKAVAPRKKASSGPVTGGVGRRKAAVARVWIRRGTGGVAINAQRCADYFNTDETRTEAVKSLVVCDALAKYDVVANVAGGGKCAQASAVKLGIARALVKENEGLRSTLREHGALTVDSRNKERKKPGQRGARRKFQFVKR